MLDQLMDTLKNSAHMLPFASLIMKDQPPTPATTRFIETGIMSIIAAVGGVYVSVPLIQKDIEVINANLQQMDTKIEKIDTKVEKLREDLYAPKGGWGK